MNKPGRRSWRRFVGDSFRLGSACSLDLILRSLAASTTTFRGRFGHRKSEILAMELHFPYMTVFLWLTTRTDAIFCGEQTRKTAKGLIRQRFVRTWFTLPPGLRCIPESHIFTTR